MWVRRARVRNDVRFPRIHGLRTLALAAVRIGQSDVDCPTGTVAHRYSVRPSPPWCEHEPWIPPDLLNMPSWHWMT